MSMRRGDGEESGSEDVKCFSLYSKIYCFSLISPMPLPSQNIKELFAEFEQHKAMALFLGSGTDITTVYPEGARYDHLRGSMMKWDTLLEELIKFACIEMEDNKALKKFQAPLKAAVLKQKLGNSYIPIIQHWLYSHCNRQILEDSFEYYDRYRHDPTAENMGKVPFFTLFILADLILRVKSVRAVITQNYNNFLREAIIILQKYSDKTCHYRDLIPIDVYDGWKEDPFIDNRFLIYHVHGYIPSLSEMMPKPESNHIVLSDDEFHLLSKNVYSWQNATQLHFFTHFTCMLIGLSLDDLTTLRLLRYANLENSGEKVYWLRGGGDDGDAEEQKLKAEYFATQNLHVVNDADGYKSFYHKLYTTVINPSN